MAQPIDQDKAGLRRRLGALPPPSPSVRAAVVSRISEWLDARRPGLVLGFVGMGGEIDVAPLVDRHPGIRFALTRTAPGVSLTVHPHDAPRERHPYGFEQPAAGSETLDPGEVDVVLVPGVAFTRAGDRLGRGAGYYDRFLPSVSADLVAVTVEARVLDVLPVEAHDVPMDWIATEVAVEPVEGGDS